MDEGKARLLEEPTINPRDNMKFRIQMRDILLENEEVDPVFVFQVFLNYQFAYFDVLLILSTVQYLKLARKCVLSPRDDVRAFAHYSFLALALDGPVTHLEFSEAVQFLTSNRGAIPPYLTPSVDELLNLAGGNTVPAQDFPEPGHIHSDEPHLNISSSNLDFDAIFERSPLQISEREACAQFCESLLCDSPSSVAAAFLATATSGYSDFGLVFNWFRQRRDVYDKFTTYLMSLACLFDRHISTNCLDIFGREYHLAGVRDHVMSLIEKMTAPYIGEMDPVRLPDNFNTFLGSLLSTYADYGDSVEREWLAAFQFRGSESVAHCCRALTLKYAEDRDIDVMTALLGIEILSVSPMWHYAVVLSQWADSRAANLVNDIRLTSDNVVSIAPFFWDLRILREIAATVKDEVKLTMVLYATNANQQSANPQFKFACGMKMLNMMLKDVGISDSPIFNTSRRTVQ